MPRYQEPDSTSPSLLQRAQHADEDAWKRLCALYGPVVYQWCRGAGMREHDAGDVVQEVFRSVLRGLNGFRAGDPNGTFRGWLWTITRNEVRLFFRRQRGVPVALGGSDAQMQFAEEPDRLDDSQFESTSGRSDLLRRALDLIRGDFSSVTWEAFQQFTLEERPAAEVALRLGLTDGAVRAANFRVLRRLRDEMRGQI